MDSFHASTRHTNPIESMLDGLCENDTFSSANLSHRESDGWMVKRAECLKAGHVRTTTL